MPNVKHKIRKEDLVQVIAGKERGKTGQSPQNQPRKWSCYSVRPKYGKKAMKKKSQTDRGGIVEIEAPIHISNVMIVCKKCTKPVRAGYKVIDGKKKRVCRKCGRCSDGSSDDKCCKKATAAQLLIACTRSWCSCICGACSKESKPT